LQGIGQQSPFSCNSDYFKSPNPATASVACGFFTGDKSIAEIAKSIAASPAQQASAAEREALGVDDDERMVKTAKSVVGMRLTYRRTRGAEENAAS
jgi:hypothetical protein